MSRRKRPAQDGNQDAQGGTATLDFQAAPRAAQAIRWRRLGYTYEQIAEKCGYANESGARKAVKSANAKIIAEESRELVAWQLDKLDRAFQVVMQRIVQDDNESLWAIDRLVPLLKRQAELMGLDKPPADAAQQMNVRRIYERR